MSEVNLNTFAPTSHSSERSSGEIPVLSESARVIVIGAGAFGGWSALYLQRQGYRVTLVDAWGPGNSRSSSGDETRVIRSTYGDNETYFDLNVRALQLWKENEMGFGRKVFYNSGVIWFCYNESTPLVDDSIPFARKHSNEYEYLSQDDLTRRYPLINPKDLHHAYLDPYGGYLKARESAIEVQIAFVKAGGRYIQQHVKPGSIGTSLDKVILENGDELAGDLYLFACGSWLGTMFPEVLGNVITCTKQEVYYFGTPLHASQDYDSLPAWVDVDGKDFYYGIPGNANRGFKIGVDIRGPVFNPTSDERIHDEDTLLKAREFISHRFPGLKNAPLLEHRVCPYENSPDGNFIFDVHPGASNVMFLGGGSGHGFKHGPALGELVAQTLHGDRKIPELFRLRK